jgi:hypothetical protein
MYSFGILMIIMGVLIALYGGTSFIIYAFQDSVIMGFACMFIPFFIIFFLIRNWKETKQSFFIHIAGICIATVGILLVNYQS